ncbi:hypothetical protein [Prevotella denticola]|uniref:hypothetical protein n=1 Tax=Prevotella denticola TaxID=28129 RepID=UPI001BABADB4|nr:hypothetical protein [Prevotella denticola]QUB91177.1 hypothetical protein J4855_01505 [Prevotella denticola]
MGWIKAKETSADLPILFRDIVKKMIDKWEDFTDDGGKIIERKSVKTTKLFELLTELGDEKGYKVYSHSLSKSFLKKHKKKHFVNREWLFDLCWYQEEKGGYFLKNIVLAVESEWTKRRYISKKDKDRGCTDTKDKYGAIKYDFQKLLIPNTGMCLMVFEANEEGRKELSNYFEKACSIYDGNIPEILFIAFSKQDNTFFYSYIIKKQEHT